MVPQSRKRHKHEQTPVKCAFVLSATTSEMTEKKDCDTFYLPVTSCHTAWSLLSSNAALGHHAVLLQDDGKATFVYLSEIGCWGKIVGCDLRSHRNPARLSVCAPVGALPQLEGGFTYTTCSMSFSLWLRLSHTPTSIEFTTYCLQAERCKPAVLRCGQGSNVGHDSTTPHMDRPPSGNRRWTVCIGPTVRQPRIRSLIVLFGHLCPPLS